MLMIADFYECFKKLLLFVKVKFVNVKILFEYEYFVFFLIFKTTYLNLNLYVLYFYRTFFAVTKLFNIAMLVTFFFRYVDILCITIFLWLVIYSSIYFVFFGSL